MSDQEMVPKALMLERLASKTERIKELETQLTAANEKLGSVDIESLQSQLASQTQQLEARTQELSEYRVRTEAELAMVRAGVGDPDAQALIQYKYGQLQGDNKPSLSDYIKTASESDPYIKAILSVGTTPPAQAPVVEVSTEPTPEPVDTTPAPVPPATTNGVSPIPTPAAALTLESIMNMKPQDRIARRDEIAEFFARS